MEFDMMITCKYKSIANIDVYSYFMDDSVKIIGIRHVAYLVISV